MVLLLTPEDTRGILTMKEAVNAVEQAVREWGQSVLRLNWARHRIHSPANARVSVHQGTVPGLGAAGMMTHCELVRILPDKIQKYAVRGRPVTVLYSADTGELQCIILGELSCRDLVAGGIATNSVIELRTAATSAVGMKYTARQNAASAGIFGSSGQAMNHLVALCQVRNIRRVKVYSPTIENRNAFAVNMSRLLGIEVQPCDEPREVCRDVDILMNCSNANRPLFQGDWLAKGITINAFQASNIGLVESGYSREKRRELDDETVRRTNVYVVLSKEQAQIDQQDGIYDPVSRGMLRWDQMIELKDLVAGRSTGRSSDDQIVLFNNNAGQGVTDVALGARVFQNALRAGVGLQLDLDGAQARDTELLRTTLRPAAPG